MIIYRESGKLMLVYTIKIYRNKEMAAANKDGMGNCLHQLGQFRNHPKVYESNFNPLIIFCKTATNPTTETKSL